MTNYMNCYDCAKFDKRKNVCTEGRMGKTSNYYDKPKWMGCSYFKDPDEDILTLFEEEQYE